MLGENEACATLLDVTVTYGCRMRRNEAGSKAFLRVLCAFFVSKIVQKPFYGSEQASLARSALAPQKRKRVTATRLVRSDYFDWFDRYRVGASQRDVFYQ